MADFPSSSRDFAADARRLKDPHADHAHKIQIATALRDAVDSYTATDINMFMTTLLPPLIQLVKLGQPVFVKDSPEQQLRHMYLEILLRMPMTHEQVRNSAAELIDAAIHILRVDNEENACLAIKFCLDLFRVYKADLQAHGQSFVDVVLGMYKNMDSLVLETFGGGPHGAGASPMASAASPPKSSDGSSATLLAPATRSFRVMAECPIATIILGQNNLQLIEPILHFLQVEAEPQRRAREEAAARGDLLLGTSPTIKNKSLYTAFTTAQVKSMSLLAYIIRAPNAGGPPEVVKQNQDLLPQLCIRLLQDIPMEAPGVRKEMGAAVRHIIATDFRDRFFPYIDQLLDDRLLVGVGITAKEQLRPFAYTALADLVHFRRTELTPAQLLRIIHGYSCHLHDTTISPGLQNMSTKVLAALQDQVPQKLPAPENGRVLMSILESYIVKLQATYMLFDDFMTMVKARLREKDKEKEKEKAKDKPKEEQTIQEDGSETHAYTMPRVGEMEKLKAVGRISYVVESSEDIMKDCRLLFRTLLQAIRQIVVLLRNVEGPVPDSDLFGQFFEGAFHCLSLWPGSMGEDPREKEVLELFAGVFHELQPHVFQEVWTLKMDFFVNICLEHPVALQVAQSLMANAELSRQLTSIMLKHLVDRLDTLGDQEPRPANITLRLFKMVFMSVNLLPEANETVLAPHLTRLIMDSFPLAAKAKEPMSYYLLIRALFRSISGGKFDRVYNEILPLLQELLENLNRLISHTEGNIRDLLVELCLTVPVRLTHLLPFLQHLMRPLVLALKGSPEMAAQGLRTLELCIDNLTQDFLEPCFAPVRRDLMCALYDLLRPLPASHLLSHACIRILGKLGGRNRRLQYNHPVLDYHPAAEEASILLSFDSRVENINLAPMTDLAAKSVRNSNATYRKAAFDVLKHAASLFLQDGAQGRERETVFTMALDGLFNAIHVSDLKEPATQYIRDLSKHIFMAELLNREPGPASSRRYPMSPIATTFVEWLPKSLAWSDKEELKNAVGVVRYVIEDLAGIGKEDMPMDGGQGPREPSGILHNLASAFVGMCHNESWKKKMAGCKGITIMVSTDSLPPKMTLEREFDFVRALISMLKDMPADPPRDVEDVTEALMDVIKKSDTAPVGEDGVPLHRGRMGFLTGILHMELASANNTVRSSTQQCITLLSELSRKTPTELLAGHRDRLLMPIYTKPLRALSFATQIGHIDAVTYCLNLRPPLPEPNDELLRLLSEALALADAEDQNLLGRPVHRQNSLALNRLRVACIKLLTASMPATDFFAKQPTVRQKAIQVYFKSLYSQSIDVKNAAHDGLRIVLQHQSRIPKELLQTGLRPILMNLADPKRISVSGLDGLARLLELLTHYFKVEIGLKLLEHYSSIAEPSMLHEAAFSPIAANEEIAKLVKLINIFHLLPPAANMYLENLSNLVVETESHLHAAAPTPFTDVYGKFLDRYPDEAVKYFIAKLQSPRHVQTMRNVLIAGVAPNFRDELMVALPPLLQAQLPDIPLPLLLISRDLVNSVPSWLERHPEVLEALLIMWRQRLGAATDTSGQTGSMMETKTPSILLSIFTTYLRHSMKVDLLFETVAVYTVGIPMDLSAFDHFLYQNVVAVESVALKHEILVSFLDRFGSSGISWTHKTQMLASIINPMLQVALARPEFNIGLLDGDIVTKIHSQIWHPMAGTGGNPQPADIFPDADDWLKIQLLQMSSAVIQFAPTLVVDFKKDLIKCGWNFISADDMFLRQAAYVTTARFFEAFESPVKFVLRLWQSLLRPLKETERSVEDRHLTRVALNILTPVLNKRVPSDVWIRQTRVVLHEEGHALSALSHIYQVVVTHPDVFYDCRSFLVPHMTSFLPKIGLKDAPLNSSDSRTLSLDVVDLILAWERRQQTEAEAMDTSDDDSKGTSWSTPLSLRENIVSYILRFITSIPLDQSGSKGALATRALSILEYLLSPQGWPEVTVKITFFVKVFQQLEFGENASTLALNNAKALVIVLKDKDDVYFAANASTIQTLLEKPLMGNDSALHEALQPVLNQLLAAIPPVDEGNPDQVAKTLYTWVENSINEGLKAHTNLSGTLAILHSLVLVQPKRLEGFAGALMKTLTRLTKEYTQGPPAGLDLYIPPIKACLEICKANVGYLGDQRGALLKDIVQLVEKSPSTALCKYLMDVVRDWIIERKETMYPNLKEKASLIQRMTSFMRDESLLNDLLGMVFDIYNEPSLRRSELTIRLEPIYLLGCRAKDPVLRTKFVDMFDESLPRSLSSRLQFVLGSSSWEHLGDQYWIPQALDLLLSSADGHLPLLPLFRQQNQPASTFSQSIAKSKVEDLLRPVRTLLQLNAQCTHQLWVSVFKSIWATLSRKEQQDVTRSMIALLSKDYHFRQVDTKINVIQSFLVGIHACSPPMSLPPYLVKYLGKTYNAWHIALEILQASLESYREEETSRDGTYDALAELYSELSEDDMFYGLWRRRSLFNDTNVALSFEQAGMFAIAQAQYEVAQVKSRNGQIPFNEAEYCVWEDHWVLTAQKLQQWDILFDLARAEENPDLLLESAWRHLDWNAEKETIERALNAVSDVATPRRRVFEAYTALVRSHAAGNGDRVEFIRLCDEAMQLSLRKWASLPSIVSMSHIPLLQHFQQFVELHEASAIFTALQSTTGPTLERKSAELKGVLQAWRERLPNLWDDITIWSDLVSWRQHVFNAINSTYLPLINQVPQTNPNVPVNTTFGFRGHHETAWIINRFAHVARKHQLPDVCHTSLARIYTLPNIEISEAFLKLREQARCHYQNAAELHAGLEVINNTNLMYFSTAQKAEFYTLKGMFIAKLGHNEEANTAFGQAVQTELNLPKAWAEWGRYNDRLFKETPNDMSLAANAVSCYLQAAGLYKSAKTRPLIIRVLWLLSNDDPNATVARAFETYKGDLALWYWITVIPQLLVALTYRETPYARNMLINLAKSYPQALFFHLRTLREDMIPLRRKHMQTLQAQAQAEGGKVGDSSNANGQHTSPTQASPDGSRLPGAPGSGSRGTRFAWESVDEIVAILKTAFPLLALTMETMVDQFAQRFKATQEEELVRYFNALLMEALQCHSLSVTNQGVEEPPLPMQCLDNVTRFADSALNAETRALFKADVIDPKPNLREYIRKLQSWRDKYEKVLEARPRLQPLDVLSHWLVEFQHSKFDEVEVPGQYLEHKDTNNHFVKISRFASQYELCLGTGFSYRRITILGHDGTKHSFIVQLPTSRTSRREEKLHQLFRIFNSVLVRRKETRKRVLSFYLPAAIPLHPQLRLLENDSSIVGLQDIYDQHLRELGLNKEDPVILHAEKFRAILDLQHKGNPNKQEYMNLRMELFDVVSAKMVPNNILSNYMSRSMADANNLWLLRKQFTTQMAAVTFQSYIMCCVTRTPSRYHISRSTGQIYMSDFTPGYRPNVAPLALGTNEAVPFRFTPNFQAFVGQIGLEGIMTAGIMAIGRTLSEPEYDLEQQLGLFIRDDLIAWHALNSKQINGEPALKPMVAGIVDQICKKAELLSCRVEREGATSAPANQAYSTTAVQSVVSLISTATNPQLLSRMAEQWLPWL